MTFLQPMALWGLLLIPAAIALYALAQRRRMRYAVRFTNLDLLANVVHRAPGWRRHVPTVLYLFALAALVTSLARPEATVLVPREQATVMLVMDVSGSMEAQDVEPTRLVAAQRAAASFLDQLPKEFRVGVVSFSANVQTQAEPTRDRAVIKRALQLLRANGGTAMGDGLERALDVKRAETPAPTPSPSPTPSAEPSATPAPVEDQGLPLAVVLLSDGAQTAGTTEPLDAAAHAAELGVPVYTIALGTPEGTITVPGPTRGTARQMAVPPDPETLRQIAETTGGVFFEAPTDSDLRAVYDALGSRIGFVEEQQEVTALFAGAALLLILFGGAMSVLWFNRLP